MGGFAGAGAETGLGGHGGLEMGGEGGGAWAGTGGEAAWATATAEGPLMAEAGSP